MTCESSGRTKEYLPDKGNGPLSEESGQRDDHKNAPFQGNEMIGKSNSSQSTQPTIKLFTVPYNY
jgi:hypothetical protein